MNLKGKTATVILTLLVGTAIFSPAFAFANEKKDIKDDPGARPGLMRLFKVTSRAAIGSGVVASKGTDSLTVTTKDGRTITVNVTDKTQYRRRFWGKGSFNEIQTGDTVNVIGLWTDDSHTAINASLIRDLSVQKRLGVFFGTIKSINDSVWVISTLQRGDQTVTINSTTKLIDRKGETINASDIQVGHRVRVRGIWDKTASTITEVSQVKDFDLPVTASPTPTPTPEATP